MEQPILKSQRCILRPPIVDDAEWLFKLFNDEDVVAYIEGIKWFNTDIDAVKGFLKSMERNSAHNKGFLWVIMFNESPIGFIMANDIEETPFLTFALLPEYRDKHFGSEVFVSVNEFISKTFATPKTETENPIVKKILRHHSEVLFVNNQYISSLEDLKKIAKAIETSKSLDVGLKDDILALFRDDILIKWLYYLAETGDEEALNIANLISKMSKDEGDSNILRMILRIFSGNPIQLLRRDITSQIRLNQTAFLRNHLGDMAEINVYSPINLEGQDSSDFTIELSFDVIKSSHDSVEVELNGEIKNINLEKKRKNIILPFAISMKDSLEESFVLKLDGETLCALVFQMYPPMEWTSEKCTIEGVRHLYSQQYKEARLCFKKHDSAANQFWLGIMSYIGCEGVVAPTEAYNHFMLASNKDDEKWSAISDCFQALMQMKGEGMPADLLKAQEVVSKHTDSDEGLSIIKKGISGNLTGSEYEEFLYAYNISDFNIIPKAYIEFVGISINPYYIVDAHKPIKIIVTPELSDELAKIDPHQDRLHAYIGMSTQYGDWQRTLNDWFLNSTNNTFIYDEDHKRWELSISDLRKIHDISDSEIIYKINIILRNSTGKIEIRPSWDSCYNIDCFENYSHIALCNITSLLLKFSCVAEIFNKINLKNHAIISLEMLEHFKLTGAELVKRSGVKPVY